jgi:hypothetical protein
MSIQIAARGIHILCFVPTIFQGEPAAGTGTNAIPRCCSRLKYWLSETTQRPPVVARKFLPPACAGFGGAHESALPVTGSTGPHHNVGRPRHHSCLPNQTGCQATGNDPLGHRDDETYGSGKKAIPRWYCALNVRASLTGQRPVSVTKKS